MQWQAKGLEMLWVQITSEPVAIFGSKHFYLHYATAAFFTMDLLNKLGD
jgi:hypothetical protein